MDIGQSVQGEGRRWRGCNLEGCKAAFQFSRYNSDEALVSSEVTHIGENTTREPDNSSPSPPRLQKKKTRSYGVYAASLIPGGPSDLPVLPVSFGTGAKPQRSPRAAKHGPL